MLPLPPQKAVARNCVVALGRKALCGCTDGALVLFSVRSKRMVYAFTSRAETGAAITALTAAAVEDVVAVAYADGCVVVLNVRFDAVVAMFRQCEGAAFGLSFSDCFNINKAFLIYVFLTLKFNSKIRIKSKNNKI